MNEDLIKFTRCDIFTPNKISELMCSKLKPSGNILEPSVGQGDLLKPLNLDLYNEIDVYELKKEYLDKMSPINLEVKINKYNCDFLKQNIEKKYDNIIVNPPYIRIQDLSPEYRKFLKNTFQILETGLVDIYYAFIIKCIDLLKDYGIMVCISPNSYLYNKSSLNLRKYLIDNDYIKEIIDYKQEKIFDKVSVYCCITIFTKEKKDYIIYNGNKVYKKNINKENYSLFILQNEKLKNGKLKEICKITNGIATLRDKIFIHTTKLFDEPCWYNITNGPENKFVIYPYYYDLDSKKILIIEENKFKNENPKNIGKKIKMN